MGARKTKITEGARKVKNPAKKVKITEKMVLALKPDPKGQGGQEIADTLVPGFRIRPNRQGHSYVLFTRFGGTPTRRAIGPVGKIGLADARAVARQWLQLASEGRDPKAEEKAARLAKEGRKTFGELVEVFITRHIRKQRRAAQTEREIQRELIPQLGDRPLAEITRKDIASLIGKIRDRPAPRQAHNVFGHIRRFYSWLLSQPEYEDLIAVSPCDRIRAKDLIGEKRPRQRVLSDDELRAVWQAAEATTYPYGPLVKLLLLTGARRTEASDIRWDEVDIDAAMWTIPPERYKSDKVHLVPLTKDAVTLLTDLPRWQKGDYIFSTREGNIPIDGFSKAKAQIDVLVTKALGHQPEPWVLHDLRRTVRTRLSQLRVPSEVAELVIGHAQQGLHAVYDQHQFLDERREALELWAARLRSIVSPPPANVHNIEQARRTRA
jgi:integrase